MSSRIRQNSTLSGSTIGMKSGSGFPKSVSKTGGAVINSGNGEGNSGSGNTKGITGYPGGSGTKQGPLEMNRISGYGSGGTGMQQQARPNVIKRPPMIVRRVNAGQATTSGVDRILRCLDGRLPQYGQQGRRGCQPEVRPPIVCPVGPGCYPPPPGCCFPPPGCPPLGGCCPPGYCPPPGCFPPPPGCFPAPGCCPPPPGGCFPVPPGCCPPPPMCMPLPGFTPNQAYFPRIPGPGMPQQGSPRFPSSPGINNTGGPGASDSPYFNNCNFYMNEPHETNNLTSSQYHQRQPQMYPPSAYPIAQPNCPPAPPENHMQTNNSFPRSEIKPSHPKKPKGVHDRDIIKNKSTKSSGNDNSSSELYSTRKSTSLADESSTKNSKIKCNRDKGSCSCTRCFELLVEKEVSRRLKKMCHRAGGIATNSKNSCATASTDLSEKLSLIRKRRSADSVCCGIISDESGCFERSSEELSHCRNTAALEADCKNRGQKPTCCKTEKLPDKCEGGDDFAQIGKAEKCCCNHTRPQPTPIRTKATRARNPLNNCYNTRSAPCVDAKRVNVDEATSAVGMPSMSSPCIPVPVSQMNAAVRSLREPGVPNNSHMIGKPFPPILSNTTDANFRSNTSTALPQRCQESTNSNLSHSTITRVVVTPCVDGGVRTKHVTVYKQHIHHNEDQTPHDNPIVYRRGEKRKLN